MRPAEGGGKVQEHGEVSSERTDTKQPDQILEQRTGTTRAQALNAKDVECQRLRVYEAQGS